jgi:hypothetical protein
MKALPFEETNQMILKLLPASRTEIERITKLSRTTVRMHTAQMHDDGEIYISGWTPPATCGKWMATYSVGDLPDVVLVCKTNKSRSGRKVVARKTRNEHELSLYRAQRYADMVVNSKILSTWLSPLYAMSGTGNHA